MRDAAAKRPGRFSGWRRAWFNGRLLARERSSGVYFVHSNALGSDTMVTDQTGATLMDVLYYPWGQTWTLAGSQVDVHFAAFQQSPTSIYQTPMRSYLNTTGRWLSPDPLGGDLTNPQSLNRYAYVLNNPATLTDPLGLQENDCTFANGCRQPRFNDAVSTELGCGAGFGQCYYDQNGFPILSREAQGLLGMGAAYIPIGPSGGHWEPVSKGAQSTCPGCYWNPQTDETWDPNDPANQAELLGPAGPGTTDRISGWVRNTLKNSKVAGSVVIPIPVGRGIGAVNIPFAWDSGKGCIGIGFQLGTPGAKTLGGGPLLFGNLKNSPAILGGWSWSASVTLPGFVGYQAIWNSSGTVAGPAVGIVPGVGVARSWSHCQQ